MSKVAEIVNRSREGGISPHLSVFIVNNDDWANVRCEVLRPFHAMEWQSEILQRWSARQPVYARGDLVVPSQMDPSLINVDQYYPADLEGRVAIFKASDCQESSSIRRFSVSIGSFFKGSEVPVRRTQ